MPQDNANSVIEIKFDSANLYQEASFTDAKNGAIRVLTPVTTDGSEDASRTKIFIGSTQMMTPEGPLPIQSQLPANTFQEAQEAFKSSMQKAVDQVVAEVRKMAAKAKTEDDSRIIVPGR